jgi:tetratricopeptide (TPR) repeat protein
MRALIVLTLAIVTAACSDTRQNVARALRDGDEYARSGRLADAVIKYRRALQLDEQNEAVFDGLLRAYRSAGMDADAILTCRTWTETIQSSRAARLAITDLLLAGGRPDAALVTAEAWIRSHPRDADLLVRSGRALLMLGRVDDAVVRSEKALDADALSTTAQILAADVYAARGDHPRAERTYHQAIAASATDPAAAVAYGEYLYAMNRQADAERQFRAALVTAPDDERANRALAGLLLESGRPAAAESFFQRAAASPNQQLDSRIAYADYLRHQGRTREARARLEQMIDLGDHVAAARVRLAALAFEEGNRNRAYRALDIVLRGDAPAEAWLVKANFLYRESRLREALDAVRHALAVAPDYAPAQYLAGLLYSELHDWTNARNALEQVRNDRRLGTSASLRLAELSLSVGRPADALKWIERTPRDGSAGVAAGVIGARAVAQMGDADRARRALHELAVRQQTAAPWLALGALELSTDRAQQALEAFTQAASAAPAAAEPRIGRVLALMAARRPADALGQVSDLLPFAAGDPRVLVLAADVNRAAGRPAEAVRFARQAVSANMGLWIASAVLAQALIDLGQRAEAIRVLTDAVGRHDDVAPLHVALGILRQSDGRLDDARREYERAIQLDPNHPIAANNLAWLYAELGTRMSDAAHLARVAAEALPASAEVQDTLGWVYLKAGRPMLAVMPFETAITAAPNEPTYRYHLGLAYAALRDYSKARSALQQALGSGRTFNGQIDARRVLATLQ